MIWQIILSVATLVSCADDLNDAPFPEGFMFGVATSSYQIEGAWDLNGKGKSHWDDITHNLDWITDGSNGDIACDSYHQYERDVEMIQELGVDFYRFSISWPRIFPTGQPPANQDGLNYYSKLIDLLLEKNIVPMVTLYHWDMPLELLNSGGFLNDEFPEIFGAYAEILFASFGDRVKYWFTFNEPNNCCELATFPLADGDGTYRCSRNLLLAHARAYRIYDEKFRAAQGGKIAMVIDSFWYEPATNSTQDVAAAERYTEFMFGIWANPIYHGDYPLAMRSLVSYVSQLEGLQQSRLPLLTPAEMAQIKGTHDGLFTFNFYSSKLVAYAPDIKVDDKATRQKDAHVTVFQPDDWIGPPNYSKWLRKTPWGFRKMLNWIKAHYNDPDIIITENGYSDEGETDDTARIDYHKTYLSAVLDAIHLDRVSIKGYTAWSLMDNFEWLDGYQSKFGLYRVDFTDPKRTRTPKESAKFYKKIVADRKLDIGNSAIQPTTAALLIATSTAYAIHQSIQFI